MLGALIAEEAGYDPVLGARVFARLSQPRGSTVHAPGKAAFWSTHPQSPERIAIVMETQGRLAAARAAGVDPRLVVKDDDLAERLLAAQPNTVVANAPVTTPTTGPAQAPSGEVVAPGAQSQTTASLSATGADRRLAPRGLGIAPTISYSASEVEEYCRQGWATRQLIDRTIEYNPCFYEWCRSSVDCSPGGGLALEPRRRVLGWGVVAIRTVVAGWLLCVSRDQ